MKAESRQNPPDKRPLPERGKHPGRLQVLHILEALIQVLAGLDIIAGAKSIHLHKNKEAAGIFANTEQTLIGDPVFAAGDGTADRDCLKTADFFTFDLPVRT